jgi:hypothetical protein
MPVAAAAERTSFKLPVDLSRGLPLALAPRERDVEPPGAGEELPCTGAASLSSAASASISSSRAA